MKLTHLKKTFKFSLLLLFLNLVVSCNNKGTSLQFEKNVMYEIYPDLIDSIWVNASYFHVPPPPSQIKNTPEYRIKQKKEYKKQFNEELAHYKKIGFTIDMLFLDKITKARQNQNVLKAHFKDAIVLESNIPDTIEYKINRRKFDNYKAFHITYLSRFPRAKDRQYYNELRYQIRGVFNFSRIQFDSENKYGMLTVAMNCGNMCGNGFRIYIKKVKDKWVVDKIEDAWIV
ncbi:hypothetical protein GKZ90_0024110 [Flavobacterium sp. MC2016-06]|jgi:hypothetical protein|uniref:hypothetical protein n=1 Tax=Flavobacterium sp. MC2016-06 TaxID=2676308 RepID=UPI0012BAD053|nr:hypothetical protein [Flavobacterium sp. MC2016-06]MBU3861839.1 hypothetical protein [Flavobacterium sp. MC2016-06]